MKQFLRESPKIFWSLALVLGLSAISLRLLGAAPEYIQPSLAGVREYDSVETAQEDLGFKIAIPAYFPNRYQWPPDRITAQSEPDPMSQLFFALASQGEPALVIGQIRSDAAELPVPLPWVSSIKQRVPVDINGISGTLVAGTFDGQLVHAVHWRANGFHFLTVSLGAVNELLTIVRSIHPETPSP